MSLMWIRESPPFQELQALQSATFYELQALKTATFYELQALITVQKLSLSSKSWLAIAQLKPLSLFISLLLWHKKAFDSVKKRNEK